MDNYLLQKSMYYYYGMLNDREKELYKIFLNALLNMKTTVDITGSFGASQVEKIDLYLINDRPDIFWYRGKSTLTTRNNMVVQIEFHYVYTAIQIRSIIKDIENSSLYRLINSKLSAEKSDVDKMLRLYELIIQNTEYERNAPNAMGNYYEYAYGLEGVMLKHRAVCSGYAKAFQYFASKHNLLCTIVTGQTKRERHAWNLVNLYGDYYYIDVTWGDPIFSNTNKDPNYISYDYFCITTADLRESHQPVFDYPMPMCTATKYNYYEYFGLKEMVYSVESIVRHIVNAAEKGKKEVVIKYSTQATYQHAITSLFQKSEIFEALKIASKYAKGLDTNKIKYSTNDANRTITINLVRIF